jgi:cyclophilin family peptidyl-prolyl cis-trans isomerase
MRKIAALLLLAALALPAQAQTPRVWLDTEMGPIIVELDPGAAPVTVENFLKYVDDGFYDGLIFHRVDEDFVIQGGALNPNLIYQEPTYDPIVNEAQNGLSNLRGTIAMARTSEPDSATSQFFFNLSDDNQFLDPGENTEAGYAVFGEVVFGMDTVDAISELPTSSISRPPFATITEYPRNAPVIRRAVRTDGFPLMHDHSGSWYDAGNSGVGFNVEIADNAAGVGPLAVVYWYNFTEGKQFWLTGQASFDWGDSEVTIDLYSAESGNFQEAQSEFEFYGTLTIRFEDCGNGSFSYDLTDYGSDDIAVTRLTRPDGYVCGAE